MIIYVTAKYSGIVCHLCYCCQWYCGDITCHIQCCSIVVTVTCHWHCRSINLKLMWQVCVSNTSFPLPLLWCGHYSLRITVFPVPHSYNLTLLITWYLILCNFLNEMWFMAFHLIQIMLISNLFVIFVKWENWKLLWLLMCIYLLTI